jgi:hypothetical protein
MKGDIKDKIAEQLRTLKISNFQEPKINLHSYADFAEIISLVANNNVSPDDVLNRFTEIDFDESSLEKSDGEIGQIEAEVTDKKEGWIESVFDFLDQRSIIFGDSYPFTIDKSGICLKEELSSSNFLYIYLLISSSLKFFPKIQYLLTSEFELVSKEVLNAMLPHATVYAFGSGSKFKGNARDKIKNLGKEINLDLRERILNQISINNSKEEGLDIVGWLKQSDNNPNTIIILGQCACGVSWQSKQNETRRYDRFFDFYLQPFIHALFLPIDLANRNGRFEIDKDINNNTLVFERRRIIELLKEFDITNLKSMEMIDALIEFEEDVV